jgi:hypothetical protein
LRHLAGHIDSALTCGQGGMVTCDWLLCLNNAFVRQVLDCQAKADYSMAPAALAGPALAN